MPMNLSYAEHVIATTDNRVVIGSAAAQLAGLVDAKYFQSTDIEMSLPDRNLCLAASIAAWEISVRADGQNFSGRASVTVDGEPIAIRASCPTARIEGMIDDELDSCIEFLSRQSEKQIAASIRRLLDATGGISIFQADSWPSMIGLSLPALASLARQHMEPMSSSFFGTLLYFAGSGDTVTASQLLITRQGGPSPRSGGDPFAISQNFQPNLDPAPLILWTSQSDSEPKAN